MSSLYAVLGYPLLRSGSPVLFNRYFKQNAIDAVYLPVETTETRLKIILEVMRKTFSGFNVTSPLKKAVFDSCDDHDEVSRETGSVNLVKVDLDNLVGYNSDPAGFRFLLDHNKLNVSGKRILILGSGGAAFSIRYALTKWFRPDSVELVSRRANPDIIGSISYGDVHSHADIVVSTIPYQHQQGFLSEFVMLIERAKPSVVIDIVYDPAETHFMTATRSRNILAVGGLDMFLGQAEKAVRTWFDRDANMDLIRTLLAGKR